jgi:hypothetical protein
MDLTLRPPASPDRVLTSTVGVTLRHALANGTGLAPELVIITSVTYNGQTTLVAPTHPINLVGFGRRRLAVSAGTARAHEEDGAAALNRLRVLTATDGTTVTTQLSVPASSTQSQITAITNVVNAVQSGSLPASTLGLTTISNAWATETGAAPQSVDLVAAPVATPTPAASTSGLAGGPIAGIVIAALVVTIGGAAIFAYSKGYFGGGAASALSSPASSDAVPVKEKAAFEGTNPLQRAHAHGEDPTDPAARKSGSLVVRAAIAPTGV